MLTVLFLITLYGSLQTQAETHQPTLDIHRSETVTPGIIEKPQDDLNTSHAQKDTEIDETSSFRTERRLNSRGPLDGDGTRNSRYPNSRSFPDAPTYSDLSHLTKETILVPLVENLKLVTTMNTDAQEDTTYTTNTTGVIDTTNITGDIDTTYTTTIGDIDTTYTTTTGDIDTTNVYIDTTTEITSTTNHSISNDHSTHTLKPESSRSIEDELPDNHGHEHHHHPSYEPVVPMNFSNMGRHKEEDLGEDGETNLCSSCLCDPKQLNVYCIHEHLDHEKSHHLKLNSRIIPKMATSLTIQGFESVTIAKDTFAGQNLELRRITFDNIRDLQLTKDSLHFNEKASSNREVAVVMTACNIKKMPKETLTQYSRSEDQSSDIDLENTRFLTLNIERCKIEEIQSYALTMARLLYFNMSHTKVERMEEHSFHVDVYDEWIIEHSHLPMLKPHSICLRAQMIVVFSNNMIRGLQNRSLDITSSNQVLFEFNRLIYLGTEALMGIVPEGRGANLVFLNNTVFELENRSLLISRDYPIHERKIVGNKFNVKCDCDIREKFQPFMGITSSSDEYENETYSTLVDSSSCRVYESSSVYNNIEVYLSENCGSLPLPIIVSAAVVVVVILVTIIVCIVCTKRAEKAKEEANYLGECCYSHSFSTLHSGNQNVTSPQFSECGSWGERSSSKLHSPWVMAVPEVKTYQETEVNVHYEQTDPLNASVRGSYQEPIIDFHRRTQVRASCPFN